mgnify:CR=1 FL=1
MATLGRLIFTLAIVVIPILAAVRLEGDYYSWWVAGAAVVGMASTVLGQGGEIFSIAATLAGTVLLLVSFVQ